MIRTYEDALDYLKSREKFGIKFGLSNIDRMSEALGRPERRYRSVLIAGTNGKGSTAAFLASMLSAAGYRTGRYTSPHIRSLEERIQVDGESIPRDALASVVARVEAVGTHQKAEGWIAGTHQKAEGWIAGVELGEPTFFEAVTASAFAHFADQEVDIGVFEVGMGGRWDATNILPADVSVINPIGFDHESFLGNTIEAIAAEKAAIVKKDRPVVVGELVPEALAVVRAQAERENAPLVRARDDVTTERIRDRVYVKSALRDYGAVRLPLLGAHQLDNLAVAIRVLEIVAPEADVDAVRRGIETARWPGRLERVAGSPPLLLDAAHNVMAARQLARFLESHPRDDRVLLFGVMKDKRVYEMLELLLPHVSQLVTTRPEMSRARRPEEIATWASERGTPAEAVASSTEALERARSLAGPSGEVVVAGSIFLLGEVVGALDGGASAAVSDHTVEQTPA